MNKINIKLPCWQEWRGQNKPFPAMGWTVSATAGNPRQASETLESVP